jgi:hypothetical protein
MSLVSIRSALLGVASAFCVGVVATTFMSAGGQATPSQQGNVGAVHRQSAPLRFTQVTKQQWCTEAYNNCITGCGGSQSCQNQCVQNYNGCLR